MSDTGRPKRQQTRDLETHINTRQDRNTFLTDGGVWSWDEGSGTLAWSAPINIRRGGLATDTINGPSGIGGIQNVGEVAYVDIDRETGGQVLTVSAAALTLDDVLNSTDTRIIIGVRGADDKFYMMDGTIFSDGDSKALGTLKSTTDRNEVTVSLGEATGTFSLGGQPNNGDRVEIGGVFYEFQTVIVPASAIHVKIDGTATGTRNNLGKAILDNGIPGTDYGSGIVEHPDVTALSQGSFDILVTAKVPGDAGNSITTTAPINTSNNLIWSDTTLTGGTEPGVAYVGFDYQFAAGGNVQLAVFLGGLLLIQGVHYAEVAESPGKIAFIVPHVPTVGEELSFVNVVGGQGPPGSGAGLQDILDNSPDADTSISGQMHLWSTVGSGIGVPLFSFGDDANPVSALTELRTKGYVWFRGGPGAGDRCGILFRDGNIINSWYFVPDPTASGDMLLFNNGPDQGFSVHKDGSGMEWGSWTGGTFPLTGSWAGDGPIRWTVIEGVFDAAGQLDPPNNYIDTGITSILGVIVSLEDTAASGLFLSWEHNNGAL
jgi:hypothetical protein